jgi:hypothetical protein
MDSIHKDLLVNLYIEATKLAMKNNQVVGEKRNYYITLEQLEALFKTWIDEKGQNGE